MAQSVHECLVVFQHFWPGSVYGLFSVFNIDYDVSEWRLFIDARKYSIKAVLLHNGNIYPSIPIDHSVTLKGNLRKFEIHFR